MLRKIRKTDKLIESDAKAILMESVGAPKHDFNEFLDGLVEEGLVEVTELPNGLRAYSAKDGPSLYSVVQEKILEDLYNEGKIQ